MAIDDVMWLNNLDPQTVSIHQAQIDQYRQKLKNTERFSRVLETSFHYGHRSELLLKEMKELKSLVVCGGNASAYTAHAKNYLAHLFPDKFKPLEKSFDQACAELKPFDLICLELPTERFVAQKMILDAKKLAHDKTWIWINDYDHPIIKKAIDASQALGILKISQIHHFTGCDHKQRMWVEVMPQGK